MLVLPAAVAGLYLSHAIDGVALVVSVIPLNVVYATLLFFVWSVPAIYNTSMAPDMLSMLVFFLKRVGILICPFFISMFTVLGVDLIWMTFGAIIALISLDVARYLIEHGGSGRSADGRADRPGQAGPVPGGLERACQKIASDYGLTAREGDVLRLLGRGRTARHIAGELGDVRRHGQDAYRPHLSQARYQLAAEPARHRRGACGAELRSPAPVHSWPVLVAGLRRLL